MNKNTIWAIVLSSAVVIVSMAIQTRLFPSNRVETENFSETVQSDDENIVQKEEKKILIAENEINNSLKEENFTINTNKAEIIFTNKGGDIISYKLKDEKLKDFDTGEGVQMVDNVSELNRACSLSFGGVEEPIINDLFNYKKIDENTVLFTKKFKYENKDGTESELILGKKYTFSPDEYMFKLEVLVHGSDLKNVVYTLRTSPQIGPHFDSKLNRYENRQFVSFNGSKTKKIIISSKANQLKSYEKEYEWNGIAGKYFIELVRPENPSSMDSSYYSTQITANSYADAQAILVRKPFSKEDINDTYYVYYGPRNEKELKIYNVEEHNDWKVSNYKLNYSMQNSSWLGWLETILKWILELLNKFIRNWGVSIIVMTILIKALLFPLTKKQSLSTLKMQDIQPKMQDIQKKYADNPKKQQEEMAKLYKTAGYNPMSGCLPLILQFLLLWAMYNLFNNYFEFRGASFIPGWIPDLSVGDSLHTFRKNIPFFGNQLRILPFIYLIVQLVSGKVTGSNGAATSAQTKTQMNLMMYGMPIMFFFIFYNAPSGLLLYWTVSSLFQIFQQIFINNMMKKKRAEKSLKK